MRPIASHGGDDGFVHKYIVASIYMPLVSHEHGLTFILSQLPTQDFNSSMIAGEFTMANMGRGAYDTTGVPKPPPRPKPR